MTNQVLTYLHPDFSSRFGAVSHYQYITIHGSGDMCSGVQALKDSEAFVVAQAVSFLAETAYRHFLRRTSLLGVLSAKKVHSVWCTGFLVA